MPEAESPEAESSEAESPEAESPEAESPEAAWRLVVDPGSAGLRLDRFVAARLPRLSRARVQRLDVVDLDDPTRNLKKASIVHAGQRLFVRRPIPDAEAEVPEPRILFSDVDLLVLDKPAGLATHPTASRVVRTLTHWLARHAPGAEPAHRLDVETSGVLLCARHALADRSLKAAFAAHRAEKTYLAVIEGHPPAEVWTDETPLGFDADSAVRLKMGRGDLPCATTFRVLARGPRRSLVEARPLTGRQHQIRAHLSLGGHAVVGDKLYGPDESLFLASLERALTEAERARLGADRHALHATRLALPFRGERCFESPAPPLFAALLRA